MGKWYLTLFALMYVFSTSTAQAVIIEKDIISSGGSNMKNELFTLNGSIGQPIISISENSSERAHQGFWYVITDFNSGSTNTLDIPEGLSNLTILPNPASYQGTIVFFATEKVHLEIDIINSIGQKTDFHFEGEVYEGKNQLPFDASFMAAGQYFVNITSQNKTYSKKIVIVK